MPTPNPASTDWVPLGPGGIVGVTDELAYAEYQNNVTISSASSASPTNIITAPSITFDGVTKVVIEFCCMAVQAGGTNNPINLVLVDNGANAGQIGFVNSTATGVSSITVLAQREITPSAGAHTFAVAGYLGSAGSGFCYGGNGAGINNSPMFIRIRRVSPYVPPLGISGGDLVKLQEQILGGAQATMDFQNLPQTYKHLMFKGYVRGDNAAMQQFQCRFNNNSAGVYDYQSLTAAGGTASAAEGYGGTNAYLGDVNTASSGDAHYYSVFELLINNYAQATHYFTWQSMMATYVNATTGNQRIRHHMGGYRATGSGINRVTFFAAAGNLIAPSIIDCYAYN